MLKRWFNRKITDAILSKNASCPDCGATITRPETLHEDNLELLLRCHRCEWKGTLDHLVHRQQEKIAPIDEQPADSRIQCTINPDLSRTYFIPASHKLDALFWFSLVWLVFSSVTLYLTWGAASDDVDGISPLLLKLFVGIFPVVGFVMLGSWFWTAFVTHEITIRPGRSLRSIRRCLVFTVRKEFPITGKTKVGAVEAYEKNESPVYTVQIANSKKERLRLTTQLSDEDLGWMLAQFREMLIPHGEIPEERRGESPAVQEQPEAYCSDDLQIRDLGNGNCEMQFSLTNSVAILIAGFVFSGVGGLLVWDTYRAYGVFSGKEDDDFTKWFDLIFVIAPALFAVISTLFGVILIGTYFTASRLQRTITFLDDRVTAGKELFIQSKAKTHWKSEFERVDIIFIGSSDDRPRYTVKLIGRESVLTLCRFRSREQADNIANWAQAWLNAG